MPGTNPQLLLGPEDLAADALQEQSPENIQEIDRELARTRDPSIRAVLERERAAIDERALKMLNEPAGARDLVAMSAPSASEKNPFDQFDEKNPFDQFDEPLPVRGAVGEIAQGAVRSVFGQLPQQIGQALKWLGAEPSLERGGLGSTTYEIGQSLENVGNEYLDKRSNQLNPEVHNWFTNALASGAEMIAPSVAPLAVAAVLPETLPAWVALGLGGASMSWLYGGSQAQQTYERGIKAGLSPDDARAAGIKTGAIEAGGEILGEMGLGWLFGMTGRAIMRATGGDAVQSIFEAAKNPSYYTAFAKKLPAAYGVEIGTEVAQNYGEALVEQQAGIPQEQTPWEQGMAAVAPTFGMTTLLAPMALIGHVRATREQTTVEDESGQRTLAAGALEDANAPPSVRRAAADSVGAALTQADKNFAAAWITKAHEAIANGAPVTLDRGFVEEQDPVQKIMAATSVEEATGAALDAVKTPEEIQQQIKDVATLAQPVTGDTNASPVRSDQGVGVEVGQAEGGGGADRGGNVQQEPSQGLDANGAELRAASGDHRAAVGEGQVAGAVPRGTEAQAPVSQATSPSQARIFGKPVGELTDAEVKFAAENHRMSAHRDVAQAELARRAQAQPQAQPQAELAPSVAAAAPQGAQAAPPSAAQPTAEAAPAVPPRASYTPAQGTAELTKQLGSTVTPVARSEAPVVARMAASVIEKAFGKTVQFVKAGEAGYDKAGKAKWVTDGAVLPEDPDTVYVNLNSNRKWQAVIGHETLHALRRTNATVYNELADAVKGAVSDNAFTWAERTYGERSKDIQHEEIVANVLGDQMHEPRFWLEVFKRTGDVKALANAMFSTIDKISNKVTGASRLDYNTRSFITDAKRVRSAVAKAYASWQKDAQPFQQNAVRGVESKPGAAESKPGEKRYVIREHGSQRSNVIAETDDRVEAQKKLQALLANDPEGKYSIEDRQKQKPVESKPADAAAQDGGAAIHARSLESKPTHKHDFSPEVFKSIETFAEKTPVEGMKGAADLVDDIATEHRATLLAMMDEMGPKDRPVITLHAGDEERGIPTVYLLGWSKREGTDIHDHAGSEVGVRVMRGEIRERVFAHSPKALARIDAKQEGGIEATVHTRGLRAGTTLVIPDPYIHEFFGTSDDLAKRDVTLHAYYQPLRSMTYFKYDDKTHHLTHDGQWVENDAPRTAKGEAASKTEPALESKPASFPKFAETLPRNEKGEVVGSGGMNTRDVWNLVQRMERLAREGEPYKGWYKDSAEEILKAFGGDKRSAEIFLQLIAITSANREVKANFTLAEKALVQYAQGVAVNVGSEQTNDKINDLLYFGIPWEGRKTNTFYRSLKQYIGGAKERGATIDMHEGMIALGKKQVSDAEYTFVEKIVQHVAQRLGMSVTEAQAATWVMQKARSLMRRYMERGFHRGMSTRALRHMALADAAMNYGTIARKRWSMLGPEVSGFPSAREVRAQGRQVTAEVRPSTKLEIGRALANLSITRLQEYQKTAFARVFGDTGPGILMRALGLDRTQYRMVEGAGGYDAMLTPNEIITLNTDSATAERVAKAWMYIFKQDAVPFFRADDKLIDDPSAAQAVKIRFRDSLTNTQLREVYDSLRAQVHPGIGLTKLDHNVIALVNFHGEDGKPFLMPDAEFYAKLKAMVEKNDVGAKINGYGRFGAETSYPYHDWNEDRDGQGLLSAVAGGRPDLQARLRRWSNIFGKFAEGRAREAQRAAGVGREDTQQEVAPLQSKPDERDVDYSHVRASGMGQRIEWGERGNNWVSVTANGRYRIDRHGEGGYVAYSDGEIVRWERTRQGAIAALNDRYLEDIADGTVKDPNEGLIPTNGYAPEKVTRMVAGLKKLASVPGIFKVATSQSTKLRQVLRDADPSKQFVTEVFPTDLNDPSGITYAVTFKNGTMAFVNEDLVDKTAYVDVASFDKGTQMGSFFYPAIFNWAKNSGLKLIPDPNGLSDINTFRRTEQMLSAALKFGGTEFESPHEKQKVFGWNERPRTQADQDRNLALLALRSMKNTFSKVPEAEDLHYDFKTNQFTDDDGNVLAVKDLEAMAREFDARKWGIGRTTIARAIFMHSLIEGGPGAEALVAGKLDANKLLAETDADKLLALYSKPPSYVGTSTVALEAARKAGLYREEKPFLQRVKELMPAFASHFEQGLIDQFAPIKKLGHREYVLARMSKATDGAVEAMFLYGKPFLEDGALNVTKEGGGLTDILRRLEGEHDRFLAWIAGNRAAQLKGEGRERLFEDAEIDWLKTLNQGDMKKGGSRSTLYAEVHREFNAYSKAVLDIAEKQGLIDPESRAVWEKDFYVPFYRNMDAEVSGPTVKSGLVSQQAFKRLKGGKEELHDLLSNTLQNWSHLLSAAMKNKAALSTMEAAVRAGAAVEVPSEHLGKQMQIGKVLHALDGGSERYFVLEDPFIVDAISSFQDVSFGPIAKIFSTTKRWLTLGVTANPAFKIRNLLRDSISSIGLSNLPYNPISNVAKAWADTAHSSEVRASLLASGGIIRFGTQLEGSRAAYVRDLINEGVDPDSVLDKEHKVVAMLKLAWDHYQEFGDRGENVNRVALYKQLRAEGKDHLEASYQARDLLDFSKQGTWRAIRFLVQAVPFFNARLQGLARLAEAGKENPARMGYVLGAVGLASMALMLAYKDDDDWKKREDWDRDNFWWFKVGTTAFRIPKPFEIGAIGTFAERMLEYGVSDEMTGKKLATRFASILGDNLSMNPTPQLVKPLIELYANKDFFRGKPIETQGMENLSPSERIGRSTSAAAVAAGKAGVLSPVQIDHLIRSYFGWFGTSATTVLDYGLRPTMGLPAQPAGSLKDAFLVGNFAESLPTNTSRYLTDFYNSSVQIKQAYEDWRNAVATLQPEKARALREENKEEIALHPATAATERQLATYNRMEKVIQASQSMTPSEKRARLNTLDALKGEAAKRFSDTLVKRRAAEAARP